MVIVFVFFRFFCFVVAILFDLVHDAEAIHGLGVLLIASRNLAVAVSRASLICQKRFSDAVSS